MAADIRLVVLAALNSGPQTGYGLRQKIAELFEPFFGASQGALYPAIAKCLAAGEVSEIATSGPSHQGTSLDKRQFSITNLGQEVLHQRIKALKGTESIRSEFLIAMTMASLMDEDDLLRLVDERIAEVHSVSRLPTVATSSSGQFVRRYQQALARAALDFLKGEGQAILRAELRERQSK